MKTATWSIEVTRGQTHDVTMSLTVDDQPVDLTDYSALMQVRANHTEDADLIIELSTDNGRLIIDGPAGTIRRLITAEDTATLNPREYFYDMLIESPSTTVDYLVRGIFTVIGRISVNG